MLAEAPALTSKLELASMVALSHVTLDVCAAVMEEFWQLTVESPAQLTIESTQVIYTFFGMVKCALPSASNLSVASLTKLPRITSPSRDVRCP